MSSQTAHRQTAMAFQRETQIGLYSNRHEDTLRTAAWFWDTAAMLSILGFIPLAMATLSIWLDIQ